MGEVGIEPTPARGPRIYSPLKLTNSNLSPEKGNQRVESNHHLLHLPMARG